NDYVTSFKTLGPTGDDLAGLAQIYPVMQITATKRPLIDDFAFVQGRTVDITGVPVFDRNVYLVKHAPYANQTTLTPWLVRHGKVSGTARLGPLSVVGAVDTASGSKTTGEFRIVGVSANPIIPPLTPTAYDIVTEPLESVGISPTNLILSEWWF